MKNETEKQITRHSLPTRMCFNFFDPPHKNFEILPTLIAHIAKAPQANATTKALAKSAIFPTHRRNIDEIKYYELKRIRTRKSSKNQSINPFQ